MARGPRRNHTPAFKSKVAPAAVGVEQTLGALAQQFDVDANQIKQWRDRLLDGAVSGFGNDAKSAAPAPGVDVKTLHAKIGELTLENDFFKSGAHQGGVGERKRPIDRKHQLSLTRQAKALGISRGSIYYLPRPRVRCRSGFDALDRRTAS